MAAYRVLVVLSVECRKGPYLDLCYVLSTWQTSASSLQSFGLKHHTYVDDNQIYASCFLAECASLKIKVIDCIDVVDKWMTSNRLMLNPSKSEFLWCSSPRRILLLDQSVFVLRDGSIDVSSVVRNLDAFVDVTKSMNNHINRLVRSSYYQLRRVKSLRHALPTSTAIQLVN